MRKIIIIAGLLSIGVLAGCRPAGVVSPNSPSPVLTPVMPPSSPDATPQGPNPVNTSAAPVSGLHLTATVGPTCPGPERPGQECTKPYTGSFVVTNSSNTEVASITTNQDGKATVDLPPGVYTITPKVEGRSPAATPTTVTVVSGQYAEVSLALDTGMR